MKKQIGKIILVLLVICAVSICLVQTSEAGSGVVYISSKSTPSYFMRKAVRYTSEIPSWVKSANPYIHTDYYYLKQYGFSRTQNWTSVPADYHYLDNNGNGTYDKWTDTQLYCMQRIKYSPSTKAYTEISYSLNDTTKRGLLVIWQNGFPYNNMGLSDDAALYATQQAMRCWLAEQERNGSDMNVYHFNWDDIADFGGYLQPNGSVGGSSNVWNAMVDLLNKARTVKNSTQYERVSSINATAYGGTISGAYFVNTVSVNPTNCNNGFNYDTSKLPSGSYVTQNGNTLYVHIPFSETNANKSYTLTVNGYDNATTQNMVFYGPVSDGNRQVVAGLDSTKSYHVASASVTLTTPAPNLQVHNIGVIGSKTEFITGESISITANIANVLYGYAFGSTARAELYNVSTGHVYQTKTISVGNIGGHGKWGISCNFTAPNVANGTRLGVRITADANGQVIETNENDNVATLGITIRTQPDLVVQTLSTNKTTYDPGETITVSVNVKNNGGSTAGASTLTIAPTGLTAKTVSVPAIGSGGTSRTYTFTFTAPSNAADSALRIISTADATNVVQESNEGNNTRSTTVYIRGLPDLVVQTMTTDKSTYECGDTVTVKVSVSNVGRSTAGASTLTISPTGLTAQSISVPALARDSTSRTYTLTFTAPTVMSDTVLQITATADSQNTVREGNENNNTKQTAITVLALKPDLTFGDDSTLTSYYEGKDFVLSVQVRNLTAQSVASAEVKLQIGNKTVTETLCVPGNGTNIVVFRMTAPEAGDYPVLLTIDPDNKIAERLPNGEYNNKSNESGSIKYDGSSGAVTTSVIELVRNNMPDSLSEELEDDYISQNKTVTALPELSKSTYHTWTEYRYENGSYVQKSFWAELITTFEITPDPRVYIKDCPDLMESGFGVYVTATTKVDTNYDQPEKLISPQMYWVFYPETGYFVDSDWYRYADSLEIKSGSLGQISTNTWQYAVSAYSVTNSRLHYTPVWFPDGLYEAAGQAFYGWSPAGQLYQQLGDTVEIEGDMYDRFPVLNW